MLLDYGKTLWLTESQISALENRQREGANKIKAHLRGSQKSSNGSGKNGRRKSGTNSGSYSGNRKCRNCGGSYRHEGEKTSCQAYKKECNNCGRLRHFKIVCRSDYKPKRSGLRRQNLRTIETDSSDSDNENTFRIIISSKLGRM